jgi:cellobiose dehydrogenase (acceptor)
MHFTNLAGWLSAAGLAAATSYDYIVVGGGPSGIITAERLTAANKSVLLLERGQGPTVGTGANVTLPWDNQLTPIDIPGLSEGVAATDVWQSYICKDAPMATACVLGGGSTVNYMVFVHPSEHDFDDKWPVGWKWNDVKAAAERLYSRNRGTTLPSADGKLYEQKLYKSLSKVLGRFGFQSVDMIEQPNEKHEVFSHPSWNVKDQLRAGPLRTYLPLAQERGNFALRTGTKVIRIVRDGSKMTGVEIEAATGINKNEIISIKPNGRIVLAGGATQSPRVLWNSGIGRAAQIETAAKSGVQLPARDQWIDLPVGEGLKDHPIFSLTFKSNETFNKRDGPAILNGTDLTDIVAYTSNRTGSLTEGKHELILFTSREGSDGQTRFFQGSCAADSEGVFTIKVYLTHGLTSSGTLSLNETTQATYISETPYLTTEADKKSASEFVGELLQKLLSRGTGYSLVTPTNVTALIGNIGAGNHYVGTTKIGTDSGLENGTAVVDLDTKVYGTDNLVSRIPFHSLPPDLSLTPPSSSSTVASTPTCPLATSRPPSWWSPRPLSPRSWLLSKARDPPGSCKSASNFGG